MTSPSGFVTESKRWKRWNRVFLQRFDYYSINSSSDCMSEEYFLYLTHPFKNDVRLYSGFIFFDTTSCFNWKSLDLSFTVYLIYCKYYCVLCIYHEWSTTSNMTHDMYIIEQIRRVMYTFIISNESRMSTPITSCFQYRFLNFMVRQPIYKVFNFECLGQFFLWLIFGEEYLLFRLQVFLYLFYSFA